MKKNRLHFQLLAGLLASSAALASDYRIESHTLANDKLNFSFTPELGGRGLGFSAAGHANLLKLGDAVREQPSPDVTANAGFIPYFGHIVWPGPQSDWWQQQIIHPERRAAKAVWPPDPFTVLEKSSLTQSSATSAEMVLPTSPITGLQLTKRFTLENETLLHEVEAVNRRDEPVSWDIWFNTRVPATTRVYVPIENFSGDLRLQKFPEMLGTVTADTEKSARGYFDFARGAEIKAKAFIEPAAGWLAAFTDDQLFVIEFPLQPRASIHPEQGQVELYLEQDPRSPDAGVLELEVHAPYRKLAPGESMSATETWRALPYSGEQTVEAHLQALRALGLATL